MLQVLLIPVICYLLLLVEFCLFNLFGRWGDPNLLLLAVIFFNLYSGIRFSLWAALWAGIFSDCFSTMPFGTHIFAYVACAYLSTFIRRTFYERGSDFSKLFMVLSVVNQISVKRSAPMAICLAADRKLSTATGSPGCFGPAILISVL